MFKSDIQHQFWLTKKIVQRKLGDKEDECVKESDASLDAKIELFRSLSIGGSKLLKICELYLERLTVLAANENALGKFMCEISLCDGITEKYTKVVGKSISYGSKGRELVKPSLTRLIHELGTFNSHAVRDAAGTIDQMEKERTEYRASLSWMKSASANLDPDSNRAIQKFRKTQQMVKQSKVKFEKLEQDCLEKIDLLVAARCNLFSYVLINYQQALMKSFENTIEVFRSAVEFMKSDTRPATDVFSAPNTESDRSLFFNEYKDEQKAGDKPEETPKEEPKQEEDLVLFDSFINDGSESFLPSELLQWDTMETTNLELLSSLGPATEDSTPKAAPQGQLTPAPASKKATKSNWYDLFAELDPLGDFNNVNSVFNGGGEAI